MRLFPRNQPVVSASLAALYLLLIAVLGYGGYSLTTSDPVLISDGGTLLPIAGNIPKALRQKAEALEKAFKDANTTAAKQTVRMTIVDALPWRTPDVSRFEADVIENLQAVLVAEKQAHAGQLPGGKGIVVKLAVTGDSTDWDPRLTTEILHRARPDHIMAVIGFGPSDGIRLAQLQQLGNAGLPLVAAVSTADDFHDGPSTDPTRIPHFVRISSPNKDEAKALVSFSRGMVAKAARVISLSGTDTGVSGTTLPDSYVTSLADAFQSQLQLDGASVPLPLTYNPAQTDHPQNSTMTSYANMICPIGPPAPDKALPSTLVYFAGRHQALATLLAALDPVCRNTQVTILTGDDAELTPLAGDFSAAGHALTHNVTLDYTAHTNAGQWARAGLPRPAKLDLLTSGLSSIGAVPTNQSTMGYDSMLVTLTAIGTIHPGASGQPSADQMPPWHSLGCPAPIPGASGVLSFLPSGNPQDKVVPILWRRPTGDKVQVPAWPENVRLAEQPQGRVINCDSLPPE
jgi:hypothetical protein